MPVGIVNAGLRELCRVPKAKLIAFSPIRVGDSFINLRKGKLIASYELDVSVGWAGKAADGTEVSGKLSLPYISEVRWQPDHTFPAAFKESRARRQ